MNNSSIAHPSRRRVLKTLFGGLTLIPLVQLTGCSGGDSEPAAPAAPASAAPRPAAEPRPAAQPEPAAEPTADTSDWPRLSEDDPAAQALGYRHDAADVDPAAFPRYQPGQLCSNCSLYMATDGSEWAGCPIFRNKLVAADGWCVSWVPLS